MIEPLFAIFIENKNEFNKCKSFQSETRHKATTNNILIIIVFNLEQIYTQPMMKQTLIITIEYKCAAQHIQEER